VIVVVSRPGPKSPETLWASVLTQELQSGSCPRRDPVWAKCVLCRLPPPTGDVPRLPDHVLFKLRRQLSGVIQDGFNSAHKGILHR
jgi:hypothetical protein